MNSNVVEVAWNCEDADTGAVAAFTEPELLANSLDQLIEAVMADKIAQLVMLKTQSHSIGNEVRRRSICS